MIDARKDGSRPGETILVVDDNAPNRLLAEAMLETAGYKVVLAESGLRALELFEKAPADLVVLDLLMPGIDGFETFKRLRALSAGANVPVIIVTALTDFGTVQRAIDLAADDFLAKPVNRVELLARVRYLLDSRRRKQEQQRLDEAAREVASGESSAEVERQREALSAMVVHDLKHPLSAIFFNAGMLKRDTALGVKGHEKVDRILRACETLNAMIVNLLDIHRSESGSLPLVLSEFEAAELLDDVVGAMGARAEANNQRLELRAQAGAERVRGDREVLRRVLENLLDNSIKYSPAGSTIAIDSRRSGGVLELRVCDEGPGIPPEFRGKIFQKYAQLERDADRRGRSSQGLGLVFCRVAVEAHKGKIWVEDNEPRGSRFCVAVPVGT